MRAYKKLNPDEKPLEITREILDKMIEDYKNGMSVGQISIAHKITNLRVIKAFKRAGVVFRNNRDGIKLAHSQGRMSKNGEPPLVEWGSGKIVDRRSGYIFLRIPDHYTNPKNGYVREHIVIWEKYNKKRLPKGWHIHHINGDKKDNRPENLLALKSKDHANLIPKLYAKIKELEDQISVLKEGRE